MLANQYCAKLRDKIEKAENDFSKECMRETKKELCASLNEEQKKLLMHYEIHIQNWLDYVHYEIEEKLFTLGVRVGMELRDSFGEYDL